MRDFCKFGCGNAISFQVDEFMTISRLAMCYVAAKVETVEGGRSIFLWSRGSP